MNTPNLYIPFRIIQTTTSTAQLFKSGEIVSNFNKCGMFFCRHGEVWVSTGSQNYRIKRGDIYIYFPSTIVRILRRSEDAEGVIAEVDVDYTIQQVNNVVNIENLLFIREHPCVSLSDEQAVHLNQLLTNLWERINKETNANSNTVLTPLVITLIKSMGQTLLYEVLNIYFANRPLKPLPQNKKDTVFHNFILALFQYYRKEREVAFYAQLQHITPRYFSTIIKESSGSHPSSWIIQMVITEAKLLLEKSDLSIKEITEELNFPTQSFFGKYFKQYVGVPPKVYRSRRNKEE